jgi:hypothetical protein
MRSPSTRRKNTSRRAPNLSDVEGKEHDDNAAAVATVNNSSR